MLAFSRLRMAATHWVKENTMAEEATTHGAVMPKRKSKAAKKAGSKKPSGPKVKFEGSKTDFIRKHAKLKPLQVEAKAKEAGLKISAGYVSSVRSKAKGASPGTKRSSAAGTSSRAGAEAEFRRAARAITLDRAQEILNEIAAAYEG